MNNGRRRTIKWGSIAAVCVVAATAASIAGTASAATEPGAPIQVDLAADGGQPDGGVFLESALNADGRYVAFSSQAANLVAADTDDGPDVFLRDTVAGSTELISVGVDGVKGASGSYYPAVSGDARYVAFTSAAPLDPQDGNGNDDVYLRDRLAGATRWITAPPAGGQQRSTRSGAPSISADGQRIAFASYARLVPEDTNDLIDTYAYDVATATMQLVSVGPAGEPVDKSDYWHDVRISGDGRYVGFTSVAGNLVDGDTNRTGDAFVRDLQEQKTTLVSSTSDGVPGNDFSAVSSISGDGRFVAFLTTATNLEDAEYGTTRQPVYVKDRQSGVTTREDGAGLYGYRGYDDPELSADGRYLAFRGYPGDVEGTFPGARLNAYRLDRQTRVVTPMSRTLTGRAAYQGVWNLALSADGRHLAYSSMDPNLAGGDGTESVFVSAVGDPTR